MKGQKQQIQNLLNSTKESLKTKQQELIDCEEAQIVIQKVAQLTQEELKIHISNLVTLALESVFDEPYEFEVDFVQRRGQSEADLWFVIDGERIDPLSASGGGVVDVAAFGLRVSLWSLQKPRSRSIIVLDEPFKYLSSNYQQKAGELLKVISEKLKLQILMISHIEPLVEAADNVIKISQKKGVSYVL